MAKQRIKSTQINWSDFSLNIKTALSTTNATPVNSTNLNLASVGAAVTFTVSDTCYALVTVTVAVQSTSDFENKPLIYLDGTVVAQAQYSAAAGNANSRVNPRTFQAPVTLTAGSHTISAGIVVIAATSAAVINGNAQVGVIVLGNVTA